MSGAMMLRRDAIRIILDGLGDGHLTVAANGYISRDAYGCRSSPEDFYMLGSMGLCAAIGLGVALSRPGASVVVLDGDGNLLMGMGVLPMVGAWQPERFLHFVLDNGTYGSTGAQPTVAGAVDFAAAARSSGYRRAVSIDTADALRETVQAWAGEQGPSLVHVRVSAEEPGASPRVEPEPPEVARRFAARVREAGR
jgi:thiamine pyrophosphate-dependent acetolactate synthase large subunit-like protein